jgi:CDP-alcohol phosphatidyltransferase
MSTFLTFPTLLTWTRIAAIPFLVWVYEWSIPLFERNLIATAMFILFALTDWLDGFLARKLNQTSAFGAFLDPVADKFLVCASLLILVALGRTPAYHWAHHHWTRNRYFRASRMDGDHWRIQERGREHGGQDENHGSDGGNSFFAF